jgi:hypothetical protein
MMKETMKQAGYRHVATFFKGEHLLEDTKTGKRELWLANKNHASYGIIYKNTHLEFARSISAE